MKTSKSEYPRTFTFFGNFAGEESSKTMKFNNEDELRKHLDEIMGEQDSILHQQYLPSLKKIRLRK